MKIQRYNDFNLTESMVEYFINEFNTQIVTESSSEDSQSTLKKIVSDND